MHGWPSASDGGSEIARIQPASTNRILTARRKSTTPACMPRSICHKPAIQMVLIASVCDTQLLLEWENMARLYDMETVSRQTHRDGLTERGRLDY